MSEKELLIKLIREDINLHDGICRVIGRKKVEEVADYLIAKGVKVPVPCRDCKHWHKNGSGCGWCEAWDGGRFHDNFCNYGERKDDGK